jgi:nitrogen regulatory protein PII
MLKPMKLITAIIRHEKVEDVKEALTNIKVTGMTVREVRGHGRQKGHKAVYHGAEYSLTLLPKTVLETVVPDEIADQVVKTIIEKAKTGEIGDGRVFVYPVEQSYNVRTGESDII